LKLIYPFRADQNVLWMWRIVEDMLLKSLKASKEVKGVITKLEEEVRARNVAPSSAAVHLLNTYLAVKDKTYVFPPPPPQKYKPQKEKKEKRKKKKTYIRVRNSKSDEKKRYLCLKIK
jgi:hypothetical protein